MSKNAALGQVYQKKTDREHILDAPDTYIGSVDETEYEVNMFSAGFVVLPIPAEVVKFWQELLDTQGDDGNFFNF